MKFKEFLKNLFVNVKDGVSRFFVAFICSVLGFLTISYTIIFEPDDAEVIISLCMTYALVAVLSVLLKTAQEYICEKIKGIIQYIICGVVAVAGFVLIKQNLDSLYTLMAYIGIIIAMLCFIFFVLMRGETRDTAFPKIVTSYVFASAISGVLSSGLSTCIGAFQSLIFSWDNFYKIYFIINLFVWMIGFINLFLALMPKKDVPIVQSKIYRVFVLFAMLPLYILLIAILLIYLAKIVITQNMPVGEINWFASFASIFFIFILMSVMQYTEKLAKLFTKYGGYFLIPVLVMQAIAVFERINAYGLTTPRTVSLVLIIISVLFILGTIIIPKHLNKIALASGIIVLIVTITPFNVIDMPIASQTKILKTTLEANGMLENGVVIPKQDISKEDAEKILSSYKYLKYDADNVPGFIPVGDKKTQEIFGFDENIFDEEQDRIYCNFYSKSAVTTSGYTKMKEISYEKGDIISFEFEGEKYEIDARKIAQELYAEYGQSHSQLDIYTVDENTELYIKSFNFEIEDGEVVYTRLSGLIFLR